MAGKEAKYEYLWETEGQKYFLVQKGDGEYFIFRTPGKLEDKAEDRNTLRAWEGETARWGNIPRRIRKLIQRKNLKPLETDQKVLVSKQ